MIVISGDSALSAVEVASPNRPIFGYDNIVTIFNVAATTEDADFPITNVANPATDLKWRGLNSTSPQYITVITGTADDLDYVGIAGNNWGTIGAEVSLEVDTGSGFVQEIEPFVPEDDKPLVLRFTKGPYVGVRVKLENMTDVPEAAVMYLGALIISPRSLYVGHTPITYGRNPIIVDGMSQSGKYLGSIETGRTNQTSIPLNNLTASWYRNNLDQVVAERKPFFWGWRPTTYPKEVGYVWAVGKPVPRNQRNNGMMNIDINVEGEA